MGGFSGFDVVLWRALGLGTQFPQFRINHTVEWQRDYSAMGLTAD
jgi:hypothetical protein